MNSCPLFLEGEYAAVLKSEMGLLGAQLRVEIDDLYGHLFHSHARHDVILCVGDQDV